MTEDPEQPSRLVAQFPRLFRGRDPALGITTGPGWTRLLMQLLESIDQLLDDSEAALFRVEQVKQKFGGLSVYYAIDDSFGMVLDVISDESVSSIRKPPRANSNFPQEPVDGLIAKAVALARTTCELCGNPGSLRKCRWLRVLCDPCSVELSSKRHRHE